IGLLGDDDRLLPGYVHRVVASLESDPEVGIAFTNILFEEAGRRWVRDCRVAPGRHDDFLPEILRENPVPISSALMRREVWEQGERDVPLVDPASADTVIFIRTA